MTEIEKATPPEASADQAAQAGRDFLVGLIIFAISLYTLIESVRMPFYGDAGALSSPGLTPGLVSLFLLVLSAALMLRSRHFRTTLGGFSIDVETKRVLTVFLIIFVYIAAMPWIGYVPATFLMLLAFQTIFAKQRTLAFLLIWGIGLSAVLTAALYYLFGQIFLIPLP
jgi:hypothetical protein